MDLSKVKLVVSDMDGTLLNSKHQVSSRFFTLFEALKKKGVMFAAASGRQYHSIVEKLAPIRDDIFVIAENGALVKDQDLELLMPILMVMPFLFLSRLRSTTPVMKYMTILVR